MSSLDGSPSRLETCGGDAGDFSGERRQKEDRKKQEILSKERKEGQRRRKMEISAKMRKKNEQESRRERQKIIK